MTARECITIVALIFAVAIIWLGSAIAALMA